MSAAVGRRDRRQSSSSRTAVEGFTCLTGSKLPPACSHFLSTEDLRQAYDILRDPEKRSAFEAVYRRFGPQAI